MKIEGEAQRVRVYIGESDHPFNLPMLLHHQCQWHARLFEAFQHKDCRLHDGPLVHWLACSELSIEALDVNNPQHIVNPLMCWQLPGRPMAGAQAAVIPPCRSGGLRRTCYSR